MSFDPTSLAWLLRVRRNGHCWPENGKAGDKNARRGLAAGIFGLFWEKGREFEAWVTEAGTPLPSRPGGRVDRGGFDRSDYAESTPSRTGRPPLRLGTHCSTNKRHHRSQPAGTQMRATS
jgi:hypothetical protein